MSKNALAAGMKSTKTSLARHHEATLIREGLGICALFVAAASWKT